MIAKDLISSEIPYLRTGDTVDRALQLMSDHKFSILPVIESQQYLGYISEEIILNHDFDLLVGEIEPINPQIYVEVTYPLVEVIKVFKDPQLVFVPVLNNGLFEGVIIKNDAFEALVNKMVLSETGGLIEITLQDHEYQLSEISRIIEQESGKITSMFLSHDANQKLILSLKLDVSQISPIINALKRFDYEVSSYFASEPVTNLEKDRYDLLMKYLSI